MRSQVQQATDLLIIVSLCNATLGLPEKPLCWVRAYLQKNTGCIFLMPLSVHNIWHVLFMLTTAGCEQSLHT